MPRRPDRPDNTRSIRLAKKFDFTVRARSVYKTVSTIQFERRRPQ